MRRSYHTSWLVAVAMTLGTNACAFEDDPRDLTLVGSHDPSEHSEPPAPLLYADAISDLDLADSSASAESRARPMPRLRQADLLDHLDHLERTPPHPEHCLDGVLDADEIGIDCGGDHCAPCAPRRPVQRRRLREPL